MNIFQEEKEKERKMSSFLSQYENAMTHLKILIEALLESFNFKKEDNTLEHLIYFLYRESLYISPTFYNFTDHVKNIEDIKISLKYIIVSNLERISSYFTNISKFNVTSKLFLRIMNEFDAEEEIRFYLGGDFTTYPLTRYNFLTRQNLLVKKCRYL